MVHRCSLCAQLRHVLKCLLFDLAFEAHLDRDHEFDAWIALRAAFLPKTKAPAFAGTLLLCVRASRVSQRLLIPPSMTSSLPTVKRDSSDAKWTNASAISRGSPKRPTGSCAMIDACMPESCVSLRPSLP